MEALVDAFRISLQSIKNARFYETERGFQGELIAELRSRLMDLELDGAIVEQEYQKRMRDHGFRIRPDLIIHIPFEGTGFESRSQGNFVVVELKRRASRSSARCDYLNLQRMCQELGYPLGIFINIDSNETFIDECSSSINGAIHAFAIRLIDGEIQVTEQSRT